MGRKETPVDPAEGPVQRFAYELRKLRQEAGGPTYRQLASRCAYSVTTLSQAAAGERLPSLAVAVAYATACGGDPEEWERRWRGASDEDAARTPVYEDDPEQPPPYRGLARFEPGDRDAFFGRSGLTAELLELVRDKRFAAIFGPSGSGKSSLLRAGLIPLLRGEEDPAQRPAAVRILTPGEHPARTHADALTAAGPDGGDGQVARETWVLVDQFEEVFTLCKDPAERARFLDLLLAARDPALRLRVVVAVRADFYGRCAEHRGLTEALREANLLVGPMSAAELREAIVRPAAAQHLVVERALTARLLHEIQGEPGGLPLMSHVLLETWRRRRGRSLTLEAYEAAGGVHGALAQTAELVHSRLSPDQALLARRILLRLIEPGEGSQDTRRPAARAELEHAGGADGAYGAASSTGTVLEHLARARLLTLDDDTVELAHECLITSWPRLRSWIEEERERLRAHRRLTEAARGWEELERDPGALYRGSRLATAEEQFPAGRRAEADLTPLERDFLGASRHGRTRERRRTRGGVAALCTLLVLALLGGVIAWQQTRTTDRQHTEAEARRVAAVADSMRTSEPARAMRLSVAAWRLADMPETRSALFGALSQPEEDALTLPADGTDPDAERLLTDDGSTLVSPERDRLARWDIARHRRLPSGKGLGVDGSEAESALSPDGRQAAGSGSDRRIRLRALARGAESGPLHGARGQPRRFTRDGRFLRVFDDLVGPGNTASVQLWDVHRRTRVFQRSLPSEDHVSDDVSPDGRLMAICRKGHGAGPLEMWRLDTDHAGGDRGQDSGWPGAAQRRLCGADRFEFTPDGRDLIAADGKGVRTWDVRTGRERPLLKQRGITDLKVSRDSRLLVAATGEEIVAWRRDGPTRAILRYPLAGEYVSGIAVDTRHGVVRYLSGVYGQVVRSLSLAGTHRTRWRPEGLDAGTYSPDGRSLATVRRKDGTARFRLRDGRTGRVTDKLPARPCGTGRTPHSDSASSSACVPLMTFNGGQTFAYGVGQVVHGPRHRELVTLWDTRRHQRLGHLDLTPRAGERQRDSAHELAGLAFAPDGRSLLASRAPAEQTVEVWDTRGPRRKQVIKGVGGRHLASHPRRNLVVTTDGRFFRPGVRPGKEAVTSRVLTQDQTDALAFSDDGRFLAAGDDSGRVTLWDGTGRRSLGLLAGTFREGGGASEPVTALAFSPRGDTLAVAGEDGTLRLWDTASHQPLGNPLPTGRDPVRALAFSPDGTSVRALGAHTSVRRYTATPERAASRVCHRASGALTRPQWNAAFRDIPYRRTC